MIRLSHYQLTASADTPDDCRLYADISLPRDSKITAVFNATFGVDEKFCISVLETDSDIIDKYCIIVVPSSCKDGLLLTNGVKPLGVVQSLNTEYYDVFYKFLEKGR